MLSSRVGFALGRDFTTGIYSLNHYIVIIVVRSPPYITPRPLQNHPFIPARISSSLPASSHVQCLHESLQCFDVMITDIIIRWAQHPLALLVPQGRCPRTSLSVTLGHVLLLEMSALFSIWLQAKICRWLGLRRHEGLEEWDGSVKISRSQSVFVAGGGGIVHNLGLGNNSPISLCSGYWRWSVGTKAGGSR